MTKCFYSKGGVWKDSIEKMKLTDGIEVKRLLCGALGKRGEFG